MPSKQKLPKETNQWNNYAHTHIFVYGMFLKSVMQSVFLCMKNMSSLIRLNQQFLAGVPQEFLKHAIPDYLVRGTNLFSLRLSNKKMTNSQHNNSHLVWINQNYAYLFSVRSAKKLFWCAQNLVIRLCARRWKRLKIAGRSIQYDALCSSLVLFPCL